MSLPPKLWLFFVVGGALGEHSWRLPFLLYLLPPLISVSEQLAEGAGPASVCVFAFYPRLIDSIFLLNAVWVLPIVSEPSVIGVSSEPPRNSEYGAQKIVGLVAGKYDALNGLYLRVYDDLSALEQAERRLYGKALDRWISTFIG